MANRILKNPIIVGIFLMSFLPLVFMHEFLPKEMDRNLQYVEYSSKGIYYTLVYPKNDITGTGDRLQDVPFKALCIIKSCTSGCCIGEINNLQCGTVDDCKIYFDSTRTGNVAAAVIIPIAVTAIFLAALFILRKKYNVAWDLSFLLAFTCMFVITIPFVIWYLCKTKPFGKSDKEINRYLIFFTN